MDRQLNPKIQRINRIFQLMSHRKNWQVFQQHLQEQHKLFLEEQSRTRAEEYLFTFLKTSKWREQLHAINIVYSAVPTMKELQGFGSLDQVEGTQICRGLFKAPVFWDALGHALWKQLKAEFELRRDDAAESGQSLNKSNPIRKRILLLNRHKEHPHPRKLSTVVKKHSSASLCECCAAGHIVCTDSYLIEPNICDIPRIIANSCKKTLKKILRSTALSLTSPVEGTSATAA